MSIYFFSETLSKYYIVCDQSLCGGYPPESKARILVQVTIYRRLRIGRDGHLDQSEAYDIS